jgi:hypothetical protein
MEIENVNTGAIHHHEKGQVVILLEAIGGMIWDGNIGLFMGSVVLADAYKSFQAILNATTHGLEK